MPDRHHDSHMRWVGLHVGQEFYKTSRQTIKRKGTMKPLTMLLLCTAVCANTQAQIDKTTVTKLESTAKKIQTAGVFLSDEAIKKRIKSSMLKERNKWKQARQDYLKVIRSLRDMGVDVDVPPTLDQLLMNSKPKDANKMLLNLAHKVKTHLVS
jgi:hypothetical protein